MTPLDDYVAPGLTRGVVMMLWRIGRIQADIERQGLTRTPPVEDPFAPSAWFCTASGCLEERTDSYGECVNCGEPVVLVWPHIVTLELDLVAQ